MVSVHSLVTEDFTLPWNKALYLLRLSWRVFWTLCGNLCLYTSGLICSVDGKHLSKHSKSWVSFTERCQNVVMGCRCDETLRRLDVLEIGCEIFRTWSWPPLCSMRSFLTCMMSSIDNLIYQNALQLLISHMVSVI